jgi:hypothetical protein
MTFFIGRSEPNSGERGKKIFPADKAKSEARNPKSERKKSEKRFHNSP